MRVFAGLIVIAALTGCANSGTGVVPPRTAESVDLERYQGTWYEQARLPMFFQRDCAQSEAHYRLQDDGSIGVLNRCRTREGEWQQAEGQAVAQVPGDTEKLWVRFDNWFSNVLPAVAKGDYWILYVDDDYRTALVGSPTRKYLWLLSREREVAPELRDKLLDVAQGQGYETSELIWRTPDSEMPSP